MSSPQPPPRLLQTCFAVSVCKSDSKVQILNRGPRFPLLGLVPLNILLNAWISHFIIPTPAVIVCPTSPPAPVLAEGFEHRSCVFRNGDSYLEEKKTTMKGKCYGIEHISTGTSRSWGRGQKKRGVGGDIETGTRVVFDNSRGPDLELVCARGQVRAIRPDTSPGPQLEPPAAGQRTT